MSFLDQPVVVAKIAQLIDLAKTGVVTIKCVDDFLNSVTIV